MKCQEAQQLIQDYLDQQCPDPQISPDYFEPLTLHLNQCAECAKTLEQERQFRQRLNQLNINAPVPLPSNGFVDKALRTAVAKNNAGQRDSHRRDPHRRDPHRQGFIKGFGSALAAGLALWAAVSLFPMDKKPLSHTAAQSGNDIISVSLNEATNVKLAFHSLKDMPGATITIDLTDNLELVGYQSRQTLEWKTDLVAGDNILTLPIKALKPNQGKIIAKVSHNNLHKSIELILDVKNDTDTDKPGISDKNNIITPVV
jgi:hypothetical protein